MFENNPKETLFSKSVLDDIQKVKFEVDEISLVKLVDSYSCDVVARDSKGFRSYRVSLEKNSNFTHFFRILDVKGQKLVSRYQWRSSL